LGAVQSIGVDIRHAPDDKRDNPQVVKRPGPAKAHGELMVDGGVDRDICVTIRLSASMRSLNS
jgi:hypothetical protein